MNAQKTFFVLAESCTGCRLCELACALFKERQVAPERARVFIERLVMDGLMIPHICLNCKKPACLEACKRKAIVKDVETGWVTINEDRCNNCLLCMAACPFNAIRKTPEDKVVLCDVCAGSPKCVEMCPTGAIQFAERNRGTAAMSA